MAGTWAEWSAAVRAATTESMRVERLVVSLERSMAAKLVDQTVARWEWKKAAPRAVAMGVHSAARSADAMVVTLAVSLERWSVAETVVTSVAVMGRPLVVVMVVATVALSVAQMVGWTV